MAYPKGFKSVRFGKTYVNITQLSQKLGMDPAYLSCAMRGTKQLTVANLSALAKELKMSQEQVLQAIADRKMTNPPRRRYAA
jgi:hypothetical protein